MLSIVVYGRNDQHGYNLHRRAALSLNALAEVLADGDEIIFVDVGSPDSVATFPEAIDDLLTEKARAVLRVVRVRQRDLVRLGVEGSHIPEGLTRNIGARRARPENHWLLFTNTDVLLVEGQRGAILDALAALPSGLHHAPRSDIPTYLWEMLARQDPVLALDTLRAEGRRLGLVQRVAAEDFAMFDNPGDFQLVSRDAFDSIAGFDESMRFPFHVDANFAVRMRLSGAKIGAFEAADCYHCEHSRTVTRMNNPNESSNDFEIYVRDVRTATPDGQKDKWGAKEESFEIFHLPSAKSRLSAYLAAQMGRNQSVRESTYRADTFNSLDYDPESVSHFVADRLCALPRDATIGWFGADPRLLDAVKMRLDGLGRSFRPVLGLPIERAAVGERACMERILNDASMLVFAFGAPGVAEFRSYKNPPAAFPASEAELQQLDVAGALRATAAYAEPRPLIVVNAVNTEFERMTRQLVLGALAPFSTRLRDGWLKPTSLPFHLRISDMALAEGVERRDGGVFAPSDVRGEVIAGGAHFDLPAGSFRIEADVELPEALSRLALQRVRLDLMSWSAILATSTTLLTQTNGVAALEFEIGSEVLAARGVAPLELRLSGNGRTSMLVKALRVIPLGPPKLSLTALARAHRA